jgi:uncharacterized protein
MSPESEPYPRSWQSSVPTSGNAAYLDSSAIVKLVVDEPETEIMRAFLRSYIHLATSILARVEVIRAARNYGPAVARQADAVLQTFSTVALTDEIVALAGNLDPTSLRSLDAIHVATALSLGPALAVLVTYDIRMVSAAQHAGLPVSSPS